VVLNSIKLVTCKCTQTDEVQLSLSKIIDICAFLISLVKKSLGFDFLTHGVWVNFENGCAEKVLGQKKKQKIADATYEYEVILLYTTGICSIILPLQLTQ